MKSAIAPWLVAGLSVAFSACSPDSVAGDPDPSLNIRSTTGEEIRAEFQATQRSIISLTSRGSFRPNEPVEIVATVRAELGADELSFSRPAD